MEMEFTEIFQQDVRIEDLRKAYTFLRDKCNVDIKYSRHPERSRSQVQLKGTMPTEYRGSNVLEMTVIQRKVREIQQRGRTLSFSHKSQFCRILSVTSKPQKNVIIVKTLCFGYLLIFVQIFHQINYKVV